MENSHKRKRKRKRIASPSDSDIVTSSKSDASHSNSRRSTYLPNATDWAFRIKVISSPHTSDDLLREAIEGLIVTCFPDGILEELGIDVVKKHMREQAAPEENIRRVQAIFDQEMIYQIARMMAPLLGNEDRLRAGIDSVVAASYKLHSKTLDPKNVIAAISDVQKSHEQLLGIKGNPQMSGLGTSGAIRESVSPRTHDEQADVKLKENPNNQSLAQKATNEGQVSSSQSSRKKPTRLLTRTRRWDVDAAQVTNYDIPLHFKRSSDIFAYHAYPVIRRDLGDSVSDSEILARIEMLLQEMSKAERQVWALSLQKLHDGDLSMLRRVSAQIFSSEGRATPFAPTHNADLLIQHEISDRGTGHTQSAIENHSANIEHSAVRIVEHDPTSSMVNIKMEPKQVDGILSGVRSVSTSQREFLPMQSSASNDKQLTIAPNSLCSPDLLPVQSLLLGDWDSRSQDCTELSHVLVHELDKRVQATSFKFSTIWSRKGCYDKAKLENFIRNSREPITSSRFRLELENKLVPWVVTHPDAFPELVTDQFIFVHSLPFDTPITDLVFGMDLRSRFANREAAIQHVQAGLTARKVSEESKFASGGHLLWPHIIECLQLYDTRGPRPWVYIDRALRYFVFQNRKLFPEIKNFALVKDWEKFTGSTW